MTRQEAFSDFLRERRQSVDAAVRLDNIFKEALPHAMKMKLRRQMIVKMFKSPKFRWTANGLCPVWLVPETHEEV